MSGKLFACPDCGNMCSYRAKLCMKCGRKIDWSDLPSARADTGRGCGFALLMVTGLVVLIALIIVTLGHFDMLP